ncbi:uncharacterized protein [Littorina saxatilis]|uniref:uncharacterized protein n=1 Tax=Littorina saxatilis TaxID=31220 RepID=UPI0038B68369
MASTNSIGLAAHNSPRACAKKVFCKTHTHKELEFYCVRCDEAVCFECRLEAHKKHRTDDLGIAVSREMKRLTREQINLQDAVDDLANAVEAMKAEQQAVLDKKAAVEKNIRDRHAVMVAAADKFREEALDSLRSVSTDIESSIAEALQRREDNLKDMLRVQQQLEETISNEAGSDIITIAKEMRKWGASRQSGDKVTSQGTNTVCRPVLHFKVTGDVILQNARDFLGSVSKTEIEAAAPEVRVVTQFQCGQEADVEVFSLCHDDGKPPGVWVSYERFDLKEDAAMALYSEDGYRQLTSLCTGKVSNKRYAEGKIMSQSVSPDCVFTNAKLHSPRHYRLDNNLAGKALVISQQVACTEPLQTQHVREFTLKVGAHRAFDVDDTEQFFAVVEEPQLPDVWRKLKLYQRQGGNPVSEYSPPTTSFQPSDVCFYRLGGQHVLLVTDEENDAIHVVDVSGGCLRFVRYLAPGCPWLIQPTAITVDVSARLWLACRGGTIICVEPVGSC